MRLTRIAALETYALALAWVQSLGGIRTDEAKYLLNIPYPHPPLLRWVMSLTDGYMFQEWLWRIILATLLVQAVWLLWDISRHLPKDQRRLLMGGWLFSAGVLLQAGSVMLAPPTALFGLLMLWMMTKKHIDPALIGLVWIAALFTSYQGFLFLPLAAAAMRRNGASWVRTGVFTVVPVLLLSLYTLSNPLSAATMLIHGTETAGQTVIDRLGGVFHLWLLGGGGILGILGTWGIIAGRRVASFLSFGLVAAYMFLSVPYPFYAILFLPLFADGLIALLKKQAITRPRCVLVPCVLSSVIVAHTMPLFVHPDEARMVMRAIAERGRSGPILIVGSFGHQWQYESSAPVQRYLPNAVGDAQAIVCMEACALPPDPQWELLPDSPVTVWVRR